MKIGKDGRAVMRNWCFGTDLWIMELVHSHTLHFVKNQGVPAAETEIETQRESLQDYRGAVLEDWSDVVEAWSQPALCGSATALNSSIITEL